MVESQAITSVQNEDEKVTNIEQEIHQARQQITETATQLQTRVNNGLNWRRIVERQPLTVVSVAVGVGALLGFITAPKSKPEPTSDKTQSNFLAPAVTTALTYAVTAGSRYLIDRFLNDKKTRVPD